MTKLAQDTFALMTDEELQRIIDAPEDKWTIMTYTGPTRCLAGHAFAFQHAIDCCDFITADKRRVHDDKYHGEPVIPLTVACTRIYQRERGEAGREDVAVDQMKSYAREELEKRRAVETLIKETQDVRDQRDLPPSHAPRHDARASQRLHEARR